MPQTDQDPLEFLVSSATSLSGELLRYSKGVGEASNDLADRVERQFNEAADTIRQGMLSASWIPDSFKPPAPPPQRCPVRLSYIQRAGLWMDRNRALTAAIVVFIGTSAFLVWHHRRLRRRTRRARRAPNGAKTELVVLAGSPHSPLTKSLALDLERKGFLVYIPVGSLEEEAAIADLRGGAPDVHPLNFDITSPESTIDMLEKLGDFLHNPQRHGTKRLHFASLVLLDAYPSTHPTGQIMNFPASAWSDILNTHILYPVSLAHAFLPLLASESRSNTPPNTFSLTPDPTSPPTTLVIVTPSNLPSLNPPLHAPESLTTAALTSYVNTLRAELPTSLPLTHIRLGSFNPLSLPHNRLLTQALARLGHLRSSSDSSSGKSSTSSPHRRVTSQSKQQALASSTAYSGVKELHNGILDAVVGRRTGTVFLGRGARTYAYVGAWVPSGLVARMMGYGKLHRDGGFGDERGEDYVYRSVEWERIEGSPTG